MKQTFFSFTTIRVSWKPAVKICLCSSFSVRLFTASYCYSSFPLQIAAMSQGALWLCLPLVLSSSIHPAIGAPLNPVTKISAEDVRHNPIFNASRFSSISEWFTAQGHVLEIAHNATQECLSHFTVYDDDSVCYGDDKWEWDAPAMLCAMSFLAGMTVAFWLCCDWAQTAILWLLGDAEDEDEDSTEKTSIIEEQDCKAREKLKEQQRRVDSVHSQNSENSIEPVRNRLESRRKSV
jgi:hypothetical protein